MEMLTIDKTGKIYLPKHVREKTAAKMFYAVTLPDGDIVLHAVRKSADPLKDFSGILKTKKSVRQLKTEAEEQAWEDFKRVRRN